MRQTESDRVLVRERASEKEKERERDSLKLDEIVAALVIQILGNSKLCNQNGFNIYKTSKM